MRHVTSDFDGNHDLRMITMRYLLKYTLLLSLVALFAVPAFAQTGDSISVGDTVTGELTDDEPQAIFTLEAEADMIVNISLTSELFDTYLTLQDEDGSIISTNDDSSGTNSMIT